jgi:hypothetical protein
MPLATEKPLSEAVPFNNWTDYLMQHDPAGPFCGSDLERFSYTKDWVRAGEPSALLSLLRVTQQVYDETMDLFYGNNLFVVVLIGDATRRGPRPHNKPHTISSTSGKRIQHLMVVTEYGWDWYDGCAPWMAFLPQLKTLWIPSKIGPDYGRPPSCHSKRGDSDGELLWGTGLEWETL